MASNTLGIRDEFVNTTEGWVGAILIGPHGEQKGVAVEPHGNVWLTEDEQILTANAPRSDADNPFIERPVPAVDGQEQAPLPPVLQVRTKGAQIKSRRPFGADAHTAEETGAAPIPAGEPVEGTRAAGEEVATPDAAPRRRKTTG